MMRQLLCVFLFILLALTCVYATYAQCDVTIAPIGNAGKCGAPVTLKITSPNFVMQRIRWYRNGSLQQVIENNWYPNGVTVAGGNGSGGAANQINHSQWFWVDNIGTVYVSDFSNHRVQKWNYAATTGTTLTGTTGVNGTAANQLYYPHGIWVDLASNTMYVNDQNNFRMQKYTLGNANGTTIAGGNGIGSGLNQFNFSTDITVDATGNLYVADFLNHRVMKWAPSATTGVIVAGNGTAGTALNQVNGPYGLYLDKDTLYIAEVYNNRVTKWAPGATSGVVVAGGNGNGSAANQFRDVEGITVDRLKNIYLGDVSNHRIQKWAPGATSGITVAGTGVAGSGSNQLNKPTGVRLNDSGYLYTVEEANARVQRFTPYIIDTFVATTVGTYTAYVDGFNGCKDTVTYVVSPPIPKPVITASGPLTFCQGENVTFSATPIGPKYVYQWKQGTSNTGTNAPTHTTGTAGSYMVIVTDSNACVDSSNILTVVVKPLPMVSLGNDTNICSTSSVTLVSSQPAGSQYLWSTGSTADNIVVTQTGTYWLRVVNNGCAATDTIKIIVVPAPTVFIGNDTTICESVPLTLGAIVPDAIYQWSTGAATPYIQVSSTGTYWVKANVDGCIVADTAEITAMPDPEIDLGADTDICVDKTVVLNATYGTNSTYQWSTGAATPTIEVAIAGIYWVKVTSQYGCVSRDSIVLKSFPKPYILLGMDTTVCEETPLILKPIYTLNEDRLEWSTGSSERQISITKGDTYIIRAINKCGDDADTINVRQIFCDIWLPNAFTPNNDGTNDVLRVLGNTGRLQDFTLNVYNRWGQEVFVSNDKNKGWNGTYNGNPCDVGTYVYMLAYSLDGNPVIQKGNVTLLR